MSLLSDLHTSKVLSSSVVKVYIDAYFSYKKYKKYYMFLILITDHTAILDNYRNFV